MAKPKKSPKTKTAKSKDEVVSSFKRMLPVKINASVTATKQDRITHALTEKKEQRELLNAESLTRKKAIKDLDAEIELLRVQCEKGTEDREVPCVQVKDYKHQKVIVRRQDTREIVEERIMTADDRQEDLLPKGEAEPVEAADPVDDDAEDEEDPIH